MGVLPKTIMQNVSAIKAVVAGGSGS